MGVLNMTPDSFSDGGCFLEPEAALDRAQSMVAEGADMIDVGGESTRPGAPAVPVDVEWSRLKPVVGKLARQLPIPLSVDTMKPEVARRALEAGASIINDVAAHRSDSDMARLVADYRAGYILMHMRGDPRTMQQNPAYNDVIDDIQTFFEQRLENLEAMGVSRDQVVLDPGLGFGKTLEHNLQLLRGLAGFKKCRRPLMLGASRKSFIGKVTEAGDARERLPGSLACACLGVANGAALLRVHDVAETRAAIRMTEAIMAGRAP